ncbi:hypothetical protein E3N88_31677 [Mikania micrantha]|uniref:Uncharacterized protein n=1 Tax=Mikania micrantha TaxID=192012 RepID=A0A5N6M8Y7_9ASTR|nr:hypothetical protein E3N88_31677 [Mikania micrantha]
MKNPISRSFQMIDESQIAFVRSTNPNAAADEFQIAMVSPGVTRRVNFYYDIILSVYYHLQIHNLEVQIEAERRSKLELEEEIRKERQERLEMQLQMKEFLKFMQRPDG